MSGATVTTIPLGAVLPVTPPLALVMVVIQMSVCEMLTVFPPVVVEELVVVVLVVDV